MQWFVSSSPSKKHLQKTKSAKRILRLYSMLLYPVKLFSVANRTHARREAMLDHYEAPTSSNQAYFTYHSRGVESVKDKMHADHTENRVHASEESSVAVNDNIRTNVDDPMCESRHRNLDDGVDDEWIFEDFIRINRERFVREEEETAKVNVMDDWVFEDFIIKTRKRFQYEKEEIISINDYSDDELDSVRSIFT